MEVSRDLSSPPAALRRHFYQVSNMAASSRRGSCAAVAELAYAPELDSGGCGFESHRLQSLARLNSYFAVVGVSACFWMIWLAGVV